MTGPADAEEDGVIDPSTLPPVPACLHCALRSTVAAHIYQHAPDAETDGSEAAKAVNMTYVMKGFAGALVDVLYQLAPERDHERLYRQFAEALEQAFIIKMLSGAEAARRADHTAH